MDYFRSPSKEAKPRGGGGAAPPEPGAKPSSLLSTLMSTPFEAGEVASELLPPLSEYEAQGG